MAKTSKRTYSRYTREARTLLSKLIRAARIERRLTSQEVAERAGISRGLMQRIEHGDLKCEIGAVFEVATIVGVKLFEASEATLAAELTRSNDKLALLPQSVRGQARKVDDDF